MDQEILSRHECRHPGEPGQAAAAALDQQPNQVRA